MSTINVDIVSPQSVANVTVSSGLNVTGDIMSSPGGLPSVGGIKVGGASNGIIQISNYNVLGSLGGGTVAIGNTGQPTGADNILIGRLPGQQLTTGTLNVCVGALAGNQLSTGGGNVFIGTNSGATNSTGQNNTYIGSNANQYLDTTGSNNICIGAASAIPALNSANSITLGNAANNVLRCAVTSITSLSDSRDKKNIEESTYGLDLIESLKPVTFEWDTRDGAKKDIKDLGFIAQDLKELDDDYLGLVYDENPEKLEASYGKLIPVLVKAIQELSAEVKELKNK